jgi:hypothetical protein
MRHKRRFPPVHLPSGVPLPPVLRLPACGSSWQFVRLLRQVCGTKSNHGNAYIIKCFVKANDGPIATLENDFVARWYQPAFLCPPKKKPKWGEFSFVRNCIVNEPRQRRKKTSTFRRPVLRSRTHLSCKIVQCAMCNVKTPWGNPANGDLLYYMNKHDAIVSTQAEEESQVFHSRQPRFDRALFQLKIPTAAPRRGLRVAGNHPTTALHISCLFTSSQLQSSLFVQICRFPRICDFSPEASVFFFPYRSATKTNSDVSSRTSFHYWTALPTISSLHTASAFPAWKLVSQPIFPIGGTSRPRKPSAPGTLSQILPVRRGSRIGAQQDLPAHICITRLCKQTPPWLQTSRKI